MVLVEPVASTTGTEEEIMIMVRPFRDDIRGRFETLIDEEIEG